MLFCLCLAHRGTGLTGESINLFNEGRTRNIRLRQWEGRSICGLSCFVLERALLTPLAPEQVADPRLHGRQCSIVPRRNDPLIPPVDNVRSNFDGSSAKRNTMSAKPDIQAKADALRQDIEREAREQQGAISQLFGTPPTKPTTRKQHT